LVVILVSPVDIFYAQDPHERYIRTVESDSDCQNTNFRNVKMRLMFSVTGLVGLLRFFVLIEDSTSELYAL